MWKTSNCCTELWLHFRSHRDVLRTLNATMPALWQKAHCFILMTKQLNRCVCPVLMHLNKCQFFDLFYLAIFIWDAATFLSHITNRNRKPEFTASGEGQVGLGKGSSAEGDGLGTGCPRQWAQPQANGVQGAFGQHFQTQGLSFDGPA